VWQVEHQFCLAENAINLLVNLRTVRSGPLNNALKLTIELAGIIDECIDVPRLAAGASVYQEMQGAVIIRRQGIQKMVPATEVA